MENLADVVSQATDPVNQTEDNLLVVLQVFNRSVAVMQGGMVSLSASTKVSIT